MIPEFVALAAFILMTAAERLHALWVRRIAPWRLGRSASRRRGHACAGGPGPRRDRAGLGLTRRSSS